MIMNIRQRLNKNYNELNGLYHDISMKLGLSDSESMVMYMLYDIQEPLTQSDIVKATGLSKQEKDTEIRRERKNDFRGLDVGEGVYEGKMKNRKKL